MFFWEFQIVQFMFDYQSGRFFLKLVGTFHKVSFIFYNELFYVGNFYFTLKDVSYMQSTFSQTYTLTYGNRNQRYFIIFITFMIQQKPLSNVLDLVC